MTTPLRIGIIGTGFIADVVAGHMPRSPSVRLTAVASRRPQAADSFVERHQASAHDLRAYATWHELVASSGVDAVYVATPTAVREEICVSAAKRGKHVLAEKPFVSSASVATITQACHEHGVAFLDATHFTHHPRTAMLKAELATRIGALQTIATTFFFPSMDRTNIRFNPAREPTGAFGDMVWYAMRAIVEYAGADVVLSSAHGYAERDAASGAVVRSAGVLRLTSGCMSTWDAGYTVGTSVQDLSLLGDRGIIQCDDFVLDWASGFPGMADEHATEFVQRAGIVGPSRYAHVATPTAHAPVSLMLDHFAALAAAPGSAANHESVVRTLATQRLLDEVWRQLHVVDHS